MAVEHKIQKFLGEKLQHDKEGNTRLTVEIYESDRDYPAVIHTFVGRTDKEANQYYHAHMKYDEFLSDAVNKGEFKGMKLKVKRK